MLKRLLIAPIRLYQRVLSPLKPMPTCRFVPTCSCYAVEAIERRGALRGTVMAVWRLLRCHPFSKGGFDPVIPSASLEKPVVPSASLEQPRSG